MVPLWSPPKAGRNFLNLKSSWHRRRRSKILAVSLKHYKRRREGGRGSKGREVGRVRGGTLPPPTVYGRSNTSLGAEVQLDSGRGGGLGQNPELHVPKGGQSQFFASANFVFPTTKSGSRGAGGRLGERWAGGTPPSLLCLSASRDGRNRFARRWAPFPDPPPHFSLQGFRDGDPDGTTGEVFRRS